MQAARAAGLVAAIFCVAAVVSHSAGFSPMDSLLQTAAPFNAAGQIPVTQAQAQAELALSQWPVAQQLQEPAPAVAPAAPLEAPGAVATPAAVTAPAAPTPQCVPPAVECVNAECLGDVGCSEVQNGVEVCGCVAPPPPPPPPAVVVGSPEWQALPENAMEAPGPAAAAGPNLAMYETGPISVQLAAYLKNKAAKAEVDAQMGEIILKELKDAQPCKLVETDDGRAFCKDESAKGGEGATAKDEGGDSGKKKNKGIFGLGYLGLAETGAKVSAPVGKEKPIPPGLRALTTSEAAQLRNAIQKIMSGASKEGLTQNEEKEMEIVKEDAGAYKG